MIHSNSLTVANAYKAEDLKHTNETEETIARCEKELQDLKTMLAGFFAHYDGKQCDLYQLATHIAETKDAGITDPNLTKNTLLLQHP